MMSTRSATDPTRSSSRLASRVASSWARPRGLLIVLPGYESSFLARQPIRFLPDLPGAPGAIYLFRRNLLRVSADLEELAREVRVTVQHEVGHLLGLDEDDLEQWGLG